MSRRGESGAVACSNTLIMKTYCEAGRSVTPGTLPSPAPFLCRCDSSLQLESSPSEALTTLYVFVPGFEENLSLNPSFPAYKLYNLS